MMLLFFIASAFAFQKQRFRGIQDAGEVIEQYSAQPLDHFDMTNQKRVNIRYFINDTFTTPTAPLLVDLGGEGTQKASAVGGRFVINSYAEKFQSLMLAIEHRFYGKSIPEGGLTQENLGYLNAAQAIEDFVMIITEVKKTYNITGPVIVFGGSYAGNLAVWIRQKYPHVVHAAVASSAPIKATTTFTEFLDVIQTDMGEKCANAWKEAVVAIEEKAATKEGLAELVKDFNTCTDMTEDEYDFTIFMQQLQATMVYYPQYNGTFSLSIEGVCEKLTQENKTAYQNMVDFAAYMFEDFEFKCAPSSYKNTLKAMADTKTEDEGNAYANTRSWSWQICTEYSYFQSVNTTTQVFAKELDDVFYYILCKDMFNVTNQRLNRLVRHTNMMYGGAHPRATNVAYTSGSTDPWSPLCKHETKAGDKNCYASYITGTAHCADLYAEVESDPENLKKQRQETLDFITQLVNDYKN